MKAYDTYKDSGIEWIGEIPSHWSSIRLKFLGESIIGIIYSPDDVVNEGEGILVLRSSNIQDSKLTFDDNVFVNKQVKEKYLTKEGDILVCARNGSAHLVGKSAFISKEYEGLTFGAFMSIVRSDLGKYLYYFFNSQIFKAQTGLFSTSTINQLTSDTLNNMSISFPSDKEEQTAIATYLDRKTAEIDTLIADKKQLLALYEEEKTAIINQAVTKGIDPKAKMKDSGVEWLGEIPEHWETIKFNHYVVLRHGYQFRDFDFTNSGLKIVKITQLKANGTLDVNDVSFIDKNRLEEFPDILIKEGDILMALTGGTIGKIVKAPKVDEPLLQNYRVGNFFPKNECLLKNFLFWVLSSDLILKQIFFDQRETGQPNIGKEDFGRMFFFLPNSIQEQQAIVQHIETECAIIDAKIEKTKKLIELLTEYRTALISEVVTGKIKITN